MVLMFFTYCLNFCMIGVLMNDYIKRVYPDKYEEYFYKLSFNVIYLISNVQIQVTKISNGFNTYYEELLISNPKIGEFLKMYTDMMSDVNEVEFIRDGVSVLSVSKSDLLNNPSNMLSTNFDFIIYSDFSSNMPNKKIIDHFPTAEDFNYQPSDVKFI